jgi:hypothetical protein
VASTMDDPLIIAPAPGRASMAFFPASSSVIGSKVSHALDSAFLFRHSCPFQQGARAV